MIQATAGAWKKEIESGSNAQIAADSKEVLYTVGDTLFILTLGTNSQVNILNVVSYKQFNKDEHMWLACQLKGLNKELLLKNLSMGEKYQFEHVADYSFNDNGSVLLMQTIRSSDNVTEMHWLNLRNLQDSVIWSGKGATINFCRFDKGGTQVAFMVTDSLNHSNSIWYYKAGFGKAVSIASDSSAGIDKSLLVSGDPIKFTARGSKILFYILEKDVPKPAISGVDVWSYTDAKLQDWQLNDAAIPRKFATVFDLANWRMVRLEQDNEKIAADYAEGGQDIQLNEECAIIYHFKDDLFAYKNDGTINESYSMSQFSWNKKLSCSAWLFSFNNGSKKLLKDNIEPVAGKFPYYRLSPNGRYIVYFDPHKKNFFSYEINTGISHNITQQIPVSFTSREDRDDRYYSATQSIFGWKEDKSVLMKDSYSDIWKIDLSCRKQPVNITNGFFQKKSRIQPHKKFGVLMISKDQTSVNGGDKIICRVKCDRYISDGYYTIDLSKPGYPEPLIRLGNPYLYNNFQKAKDTDMYLVRRENPEEPPGYFYTCDFQTYFRVTDRQPEIKEPGIKKEVISWKTFNGTVSQGVLCKPRNFDPNKKYPIIFVYYEKKVIDPFAYQPYGLGDFVDYDYLVFSPDIYFKTGETGQSAFNSIVSAARYLSKISFVDAKHMGIRGGSFGGFETNYLVTHTHLFAAAISMSGYSDFIGNIGAQDIGLRPHSLEGTGQNRQGTTIWQRPDIWIKNSPIFYADRVTTPVLLIASKSDHNVPFEQSVAFFRALRSLGKRAWLLQYDDAGHIAVISSIVGKGNNCDFCTRQLQFFDHYLKNSPAPKWMLDGIPARLKGIETGLELDSTGRRPGPGLVRDKIVRTPEQEELLKHETRVTNDGRIVDLINDNSKIKKTGNGKK